MTLEELCAVFADDSRKWFTGCTHAHSDCSDGAVSAEEAADWYREAGYDFLFLTEHEEKLAARDSLPDYAALSTDDFLVMPGLELFIRPHCDPGPHLRAVTLGTADTGHWRSDWSLADLVGFTEKRDSFMVVACPYWDGISHSDLDTLPDNTGIEIYNVTCDVVSGKGFAVDYWDYLLARGRVVHGIATDDSHWCWDVPDYGMAEIVARVQELTQECIISSLRRGAFYSTMGPRILSLELRDGQMHVETTPVARINFVSRNGDCTVVRPKDSPTITSASADISAFQRYLRIEVRDCDGRFAWTNAAVLG